MSKLTLPNDAVAAIPVVFTDQVGRPIAAPGVITASSSNDATGTVSVGADGSSIDLTPVANGDFTVTVSVGSLSASLDVSVADPVAASISIDVAHAVFSAKPAQAPTVAGS
ncbi:hypothetical protein [Labrys neptuniae]